MNPSGTPTVRVIAPAYDEEAAIADCLASRRVWRGVYDFGAQSAYWEHRLGRRVHAKS